MPLFKELLRSGESLFRDTVMLDFDFQPKVMQYRESEQQRFAIAIRPLLQSQTGRNLFVYGAPGIGKTTACKHVLRELEDETESVVPLYVNCWKENTTFKIFSNLCEQLGFAFLQNKKTSELFALIKSKLNKQSAVFVFDEIDKLEETDFLYTILEDIYRKAIFLITNYRDSYTNFDERIRSRLAPEFLAFRTYNEQEIAGILQTRRDYAFVQGCWDEEAFKELVEKCTETMDVRVGLYLMQEAGRIAEEKSSRQITLVHVGEAVRKVDDFHIKPKEDLDDEVQDLLQLVKEQSGLKMGELYDAYLASGKDLSYKSFQRRIAKLHDGRYIRTEKVSGDGGNTTLVHYAVEKKLTEF